MHRPHHEGQEAYDPQRPRSWSYGTTSIKISTRDFRYKEADRTTYRGAFVWLHSNQIIVEFLMSEGISGALWRPEILQLSCALSCLFHILFNYSGWIHRHNHVQPFSRCILAILYPSTRITVYHSSDSHSGHSLSSLLTRCFENKVYLPNNWTSWCANWWHKSPFVRSVGTAEFKVTVWIGCDIVIDGIVCCLTLHVA